MNGGSLSAAMRERCPQPSKHRYLDKTTALAQAGSILDRRKSKKHGSKELRPYRCRCGFWHLSSQAS